MRHRLYGIGALLVALFTGVASAATDDIYHYRQDNGVRVYTDRKPERRDYTRIVPFGRPTATASCRGLRDGTLQARAATYEPLIKKYAEAHGVPPRLVRAVMQVESCFDSRAVSRAGARGLMQLMPGTASDLGVRDSFDPEQNIRGGVRYLQQMLQRFNQNTSYALAAYNAGPQAVADHRGIPPYRETRNYVQRVMEFYQGGSLTRAGA